MVFWNIRYLKVHVLIGIEKRFFHVSYHLNFDLLEPYIRTGVYSINTLQQLNVLSISALKPSNLKILWVNFEILDAFKQSLQETLVLSCEHLLNDDFLPAVNVEKLLIAQEVEPWEGLSLQFKEPVQPFFYHVCVCVGLAYLQEESFFLAYLEHLGSQDQAFEGRSVEIRNIVVKPLFCVELV